MVRLIVQSHSPDAVTIEVHGRLAGRDIEVLAAERQRRLATTDRLVLELDAVSFIDAPGLSLLQCWSGPGLELRGGSAFLRRLLAEKGLTTH